MPIPEFNDAGMLPDGVWDCSLGEVAVRFVSSVEREELWGNFQQFLDYYREKNGPNVLWLDGSFVTARRAPRDVDVVADCIDASAEQTQCAVLLFIERSALKQRFCVDFWVKHPSFPNDLTQFFQYVRPDAASQLQSSRSKGILRIML